MANPSRNREWVTVFSTGDPIEAEMIKGLIVNADIPVLLRSSQISPFPETIGATGRIELLVKVSDEQRAQEIIEDSHS